MKSCVCGDSIVYQLLGEGQAVLQIDKIRIGKIPLFHVHEREAKGPSPVVIALHGFGDDKQTLLPFADTIAEQGIHVLIPDGPRHGERAANQRRYTLDHLTKMVPILIGMLRDVSTLMEYIKTSEQFDLSRIGVTGVSMGGAVALGAIANHPEVKTGVAFLATAGARQFARHHKFPKILWPAMSYLDARLDRRRIPPRSLLMLNGSVDPVIPVAHVREFVEEMQPYYGHNPGIKLIEFPGVGHAVVPEMRAHMEQWFIKHL